MQVPLQIAFRNLGHPATIEEIVRARAADLDRFADHITSCRVVVAVPHRHHEHGNLYEVRLHLSVPGEEIVVNREPPAHMEYRDMTIAIDDAFDSARRQLQDYVRRRRGFVKHHEAPPHGRVVRLFPDEGYGFLATPDGRAVYFHRESVLENGFAQLEIGAEVAFAEEAGEEGPQASTVRPVGRHHHL